MPDLQPCTRRQFDAALLSYASRPGWAYRIAHGDRCEGYADGKLVLLIRRRGEVAQHFMRPLPMGPIRDDGALYYK